VTYKHFQFLLSLTLSYGKFQTHTKVEKYDQSSMLIAFYKLHASQHYLLITTKIMHKKKTSFP